MPGQAAQLPSDQGQGGGHNGNTSSGHVRSGAGTQGSGEEDVEPETAQGDGRTCRTRTQPHGHSALAGPLDITAAELHPDRAPLSEHLQWFRSYDWASTPLGPMATWDTELRRMVNFCMSDQKATALWWGPERVCIYNAPYIPILASRHPAALGRHIFEVWPEIKNAPFGRAFDNADRTGESSSGRREPFYVERADYVEELWASWDMIPIVSH